MRISQAISSLNVSIAALMNANPNNRVGVVAFSGTSTNGTDDGEFGGYSSDNGYVRSQTSTMPRATTLLPLKSYTAGSGGNYLQITSNYLSYYYVKTATSLAAKDGSTVSSSVEVAGSTYTQGTCATSTSNEAGSTPTAGTNSVGAVNFSAIS